MKKELADALSIRTKRKITISYETKKGGEEQIEGKYNPLLSTVELAGVGAFPLSETKLWMKLHFGAIPGTVEVNKKDCPKAAPNPKP